MITIKVETDEEQWALGVALITGAITFGDWPIAVKREVPASAIVSEIPPGMGPVTSIVYPLRACCATRNDKDHRDGCPGAARTLPARDDWAHPVTAGE